MVKTGTAPRVTTKVTSEKAALAGPLDEERARSADRVSWVEAYLANRVSFIETLRAIAAEQRGKPRDPWAEALSSLKGRKDNDGVERIATDAVFDRLALRPFERTPEAGRRVKALMSALGWTPVRSRQATATGSAGRVRGYARTVA